MSDIRPDPSWADDLEPRRQPRAPKVEAPETTVGEQDRTHRHRGTAGRPGWGGDNSAVIVALLVAVFLLLVIVVL